DSTRTGSLAQAVTRYTYASDGRLLVVTEPAGHTTRHFYGGDIGDNLARIEREGRSVAIVHDSAGRVVLANDNLLGTTRRGYDLLNRPLWEAGTNADTTRFTHDALYLTQVRDAIGQTYIFH